MDATAPQKQANAGFAFDSLEAVRKQLLDLSGRNSLLNYKHPTASCIRLIDELPDQIVAELYAEKTLTFIPVPEPTEKQLIETGYIQVDSHSSNPALVKEYPNAEQWAKQLGLDTRYELPGRDVSQLGQQRHQDSDLQTLLYAPQLAAKLRGIRGKAQTAIEESGANILYLNIGFLEWFESKSSDVTRMAPLFTIPVILERSGKADKNGVYSYSIVLKDDNLLTNVTLREKLANDFDLGLPAIAEDTTPEAYFEQIQSTILRNQPRWNIRRQASLVLLNFSKQAMYEDLNPKNWPDALRIEEHPLIKQFFSSSDVQGDDSCGGYENEHLIDEIEEVHDKYPLVFDADSSQHSALIDAVNGENLVIEGPPGSGKSQTIANIIAASIANGKRVLFVAEKMAALNVVKDRLDKAGLGDFCLELHSHKTNKQKILSDLGKRLNSQDIYRVPTDIEAEIARFEDLRSKLAGYADLINSGWRKTGLTLHEIFNRATRYREQLGLAPEKLSISGIDGDNLTPVRQKELGDHAEMLAHIYDQVAEQAPGGVICHHYWYGVSNEDLRGHQQEELNHLLNEWTKVLSNIGQQWNECASHLEFESPENSLLETIEATLLSACQLPTLEGGEALAHLDQLAAQRDMFSQWLEDYASIHETHDKLNKTLKLQVLDQSDTLKKLGDALAEFTEMGVAKNRSVEEITASRQVLSETHTLLTNIEDQFGRVAANVPAVLKSCFLPSKQGIQEFATLSALINSLPMEYWRYRNVLYDNPDLDILIPTISKRLEVLRPLHEVLGEHLDVDSLPQASGLKQQYETLSAGGAFKWFSAKWRKARKQLLSHSVRPKPDTKKLLSLIPDFIHYTKVFQALDELNAEYGILHELYAGVETPIERIATLRSWYKAVRSEYGLDFGDRVVVGATLLELDRNLAVAINDLASQGLSQQVQSASESLTVLADTFAAIEPLRDACAELRNPVAQLLASVEREITSLESILLKPTHSLESLLEIRAELEQQHDAIQQWQSASLARVMLCGPLHLKVAAGQHSQQVFDAAMRTLAMVDVLKSAPPLLYSLSKSPSEQRYRAIQSKLTALQQHWIQGKEAERIFVDLGAVQIREWAESSRGDINQLIQRNQAALENPRWLVTWLDYVRVRTRMIGQGLGNIVGQLEENALSTRSLIDVVRLLIHYQLSNEVMEAHSGLAAFNGMEQMAIRKKFQQYDRRLMELQRELVAYKASRAEVPGGVATGRIKDYTELGLIKHNLSLQKPRIAVRSLLNGAGQAIQSLKPCFMMSPMSVAQFLQPGSFQFDLIVMDEASQIRPEDALGAIARGGNLIVVGDPKQLPPTSFFQKAVANDDNEDAVALEDSESILESVIPMFKNRRLRWHYRSRHETLIEFSNHKFYDSNLILFPSPTKDSDELGIRYHRVEKGRFLSRRNVEEARLIVADAAALLRSQLPSLRAYSSASSEDKRELITSIESIGIVSMNAEQQDEITLQLELVEKEDDCVREAKKLLKEFGEEVFIKNLENVQGDERDIIIISMTYGPENIGAATMHQRFGPINTDLGWRRLNVLFTRSKKRMHIFSSMDSGHVRSSQTSSRGVIALKSFLQYCETGSLPQQEHTGKAPDSDFEVAVINALATHGYDCEPQLGVSGYFLDIAVKDPGQPGRFLMGVECDGASYHSAKSTRDRDRLRQEILENLGWRVRRIWSTDWFKNPIAQLQPILNELEQLRTPEVEQHQAPLQEVPMAETPKIIDQPLPDYVGNENIIVEPHPEEESLDLRARLVNFNNQIICAESVNVDKEQGLLRPAMLEALLHAMPCSKAEFLETIPEYLRHGTAANEGKYLDDVLQLIASYGQASSI